jgi:hypothetical protein
MFEEIYGKAPKLSATSSKPLALLSSAASFQASSAFLHPCLSARGGGGRAREGEGEGEGGGGREGNRKEDQKEGGERDR